MTRLPEDKSRPEPLPCDAGALIPHEPPMVLLNRLIRKADEDIDGDTSFLDAIVPDAGPFVDSGVVLPEYFVELMAQAVAAVDGYPPKKGKAPAKGFLAGIDSFSWSGSARPGDLLKISLQKTFSFGSAFIFTGTVTGPAGELGRGQLKIWKVEEE